MFRGEAVTGRWGGAAGWCLANFNNINPGKGFTVLQYSLYQPFKCEISQNKKSGGYAITTEYDDL